MATRPYGVRLVVDNAEKFEADFDKAGKAGETAMKRIAEASRRAEGDLKVFNKGVDDSSEALDEAGAASERATSKAKVFGAIIGTAVGAAIAGFVSLAIGAKNAAEGIAAIGDAADRAGVDVDLYEKTAAALTQVGEKATNLEDNFRTMTKRIGDARAEIGKGAKSFDALGISMRNADGTAKSTEKIFDDLADAFARIDDKTVKSAAAQDIFGESGTDLIPILEKGSAGLRDLGAEAERVGLVYGGDLIRDAQAINAEFAVQAQIIDVQLKSALITAAPLIRDLTNEFIAVLPEIIAATHAFLAFLGVIEKPIKLQLEDARGRFDQLNKDRLLVQERLARQVGVDPRAPEFPAALAASGDYLAGQSARQLDEYNAALDETTDKIFKLEDQLATLNAPLPTPPAASTFAPAGGGGRGAAAKDGPFEKAIETAEKQIAALRFENETRGLTAEAIARQRLELALLAAAEEEFGTITPAIRAEIERLTSAMESQTAAKEKAKIATDELKKAEQAAAQAARQLENDFKTGIDSILGNIEDVINKTKTWEQALFAVAKAILSTNSAQNALGGLFDGIFNGGAQATTAGAGAQIQGWFGFGGAPTPSARGNAFDAGGAVIPFRLGGVVHDRTQFGFRGGIGEMAENGPELIAPIGRNSRGEMGVKIVDASGPARAEPPIVNVFSSDPQTRVTFGPSRAQGARRVRSFQARAVT